VKEADYAGFWKALPDAALLSRNKAAVEQFRFTFREEILGTLNMLRLVGLVWDATSLHPNPADACDLCGTRSEDCQVMVDGTTTAGEWANMCPKCFLERGHAIGWGTGQLYLNVGGGKWRLVAGGNPAATDESVCA
jgi:hypothetical protein